MFKISLILCYFLLKAFKSLELSSRVQSSPNIIGLGSTQVWHPKISSIMCIRWLKKFGSKDSNKTSLLIKLRNEQRFYYLTRTIKMLEKEVHCWISKLLIIIYNLIGGNILQKVKEIFCKNFSLKTTLEH